jgi:transcription elongation factor Elf1
MGRRKRKIVRLPKKKLPKTFLCPKCGEEAVRVTMEKTLPAKVMCGKCGLKLDISASPQDQLVDLYCKFTDKFYSGDLV